jgi:DNA-binding response OmpR family regulator
VRFTLGKSSPTVLVLADEPLVNFVFQNVLVSHGFQVLLAISAKEAVDQFTQHEEQIDLLIADLAIQGGSGVDVAVECARRSAKLRILVTSATSPTDWKDSDRVAVGHLLLDCASYLQKPFSAAELLKSVRAVLELRKEF